jgi:CheY-like chemotaxis protein
VLVVDDIAGDCRLLESLLAPDGYVAEAAPDLLARLYPDQVDTPR